MTTRIAWFNCQAGVAGDMTMAALVGLMTGSLRALWPYLDDDRSMRLPGEGEPVALAILCAATGVAVIALLTRVGDRGTTGHDDLT